MKKLKRSERLISLVLTFGLLAFPTVAQQKRGTTPKKTPPPQVSEPAPTFGTLISVDSYKIYCEVRDVGGLIHSSAVNDLLEPVMKLAGPPKEFKTLVKWLNVHTEVLAGSQMLVAGWPARPKLPNVLVAIEFPSAEEAQKFYPELRGFLPTLLPTPTPTPASSPGAAIPNAAAPQEKDNQPVLPPYQIKQSGSLILISDTPFTFRNLNPRNSKLLAEDQNFALARNRFASESFFFYVDMKSIEKEEKERTQKWEEEQRRIESEAANQAKEVAPPGEVNPRMTPEPSLEQPSPETPPSPAPDASGSPQATLGSSSDPSLSSSTTVVVQSGTDSAEAEAMSASMFTLYGAFFGGQSKWPEAIGAALVFEDDSYVVRALIVNSPENKTNAIPFVPQFISGPPLLPESPNVIPADAQLFVTASLDYPQIYEGMVRAIAGADESSRRFRGQPQPVRESQPESPFAVYEKKLGLKIKDDVLPLFGHEIALALIKRPATVTPDVPNAEKLKPENMPQSGHSAEPTPVIAVSVKDREAVQRLIPKILDSLAFKGANLLAKTEKRDETEITSYANFFSYAFVGDFLVLSADPDATRHVVDSYLNHQALSSDSHFRNSTRWQPRQVLGQVYVAPGLMEQYAFPRGDAGTPANEKAREFLSRLNPLIEPMTYALSNEGLGPLHELHVPKSLLLLMIAGMSNQASESPLRTNEAIAKSALRMLASAEATFQSTKGDGHYGTLDELVKEGLVSKDLMEKYGYKIEVTVSSNKLEVTAVPLEYGKTGRLSYFIDESSVLRGGDHGGGAATVADQPVQ